MTALAHPPSAPFTEHELTQAGIGKVAAARDTHREGVRRFFLDRLTATDQVVLGDV